MLGRNDRLGLAFPTAAVRGYFFFDLLAPQFLDNGIAISFDIGLTHRRVLLDPMVIVFDILALLLRDAAFRVQLEVGSLFSAMERGWLGESQARGVVSNSSKGRKSADLLRMEKRLHCTEDRMNLEILEKSVAARTDL